MKQDLEKIITQAILQYGNLKILRSDDNFPTLDNIEGNL